MTNTDIDIPKKALTLIINTVQTDPNESELLPAGPLAIKIHSVTLTTEIIFKLKSMTSSNIPIRTILILHLALISTHLKVSAQGVKLATTKEYEKLPRPSLFAGAPDYDPIHVIPESKFPEIEDQSPYNTCVGYALSYALHSYYQTTTPTQGVDATIPFSPTYLYDELRQNLSSCSTCRCNINILQAFEFLKGSGNVPKKIHPNPCVIPSKIEIGSPKYRIPGYTQITYLGNLNALKEKILEDVPVLVILGVGSDFKKWKNKSADAIFKAQDKYNEFDNHSLVVIGFDENRKAFKLLNSWGKDWGHNGYAWIDYESLLKLATLPLPSSGQYSNPGFCIDNDLQTISAGASNLEYISNQNSLIGKYAYSETISKGWYCFTIGILQTGETSKQITSVKYYTTDPSFLKKATTVARSPNFEVRIYGPKCPESISAEIVYSNGSKENVELNVCDLITNPSVVPRSQKEREKINAIASAITKGPSNFDYTIQLVGIEPLKESIREVVYDMNDKSFKHRFHITTIENDFKTGYNGYDCLDHVTILIYFKDNTIKTIDFKMCQYLGR